MSFGPSKTSMKGKTQTTMSTWTPLNHQLSNDHVFQQRRTLVGKWFDKWSDSQRKLVLEDFFFQCSKAQLRFLHKKLCFLVPEETLDFTTVLPRVLSLYIFSFLDPRSLCRCAQVSWCWKTLVELDQLWMPKCLRLGWYISFAPTPFEQGIWKRHYIEMVQEFHVTRPQTTSIQEFVLPEVKVIGRKKEALWETNPGSVQVAWHNQHKGRTGGRSSQTGEKKEPPPWRHSDKHPTDTLRFNYLENLDPIEQANLAQAKAKKYTVMKQEDGKKPLTDSTYKLRKAKSLRVSLALNCGQERQTRPDWATKASLEQPISIEIANKLAQMPQWNAGIRPGPTKQVIPRLSDKGLKALLRSHRTPPITAFEDACATIFG